MSERNEGGLWCHEVLGLLDRYVDGNLTEDELLAVRAHVQACERCARFGGAYARVVSALRGAPSESPPPDVAERVQAQLWGAE